MMTLGILSAMPQEMHHITVGMDVRSEQTIAGRSYMSGTLDGVNIVCALSRWGKVASTQTATTLINLFSTDAIVFTGVAGAVDSTLEIGDIIIGDRFVQHDFDASAVPPYKKHEIPLIGVSEFHADASLTDLAEKAAREYAASEFHLELPLEVLHRYAITTPAIRRGLIASGDQFIGSPQKLSELRAELPELLCVEMEGAAVAQVCYEHGIPFTVIRSISDKADHSAHIDFPDFLEHVASHYSHGIVSRMLKDV